MGRRRYDFEIRNTLESGSLIEFLSPGQRETIRVRLPHFTDSVTGDATEKVSPGQGKAIRISGKIFKTMSAREMKKTLPPFTTATQLRHLGEGAKMRLLVDQEVFSAEMDKDSTITPEKKARLSRGVQNGVDEVRARRRSGPSWAPMRVVEKDATAVLFSERSEICTAT